MLRELFLAYTLGNATEWGRAGDKVRPRSVRSAKKETAAAAAVSGSERCKLAIWRCLSGIMESGVKYIEKPHGLLGCADSVKNILNKKVFFKIKNV
jgi:hypothetical protein